MTEGWGAFDCGDPERQDLQNFLGFLVLLVVVTSVEQLNEKGRPLARRLLTWVKEAFEYSNKARVSHG